MNLQQPPVASPLTELCTMADAEHRKAFVAKHPELLDCKLVQELAETVRLQIRVDLAQAQSAAEAAMTIADALGDEECLGRAARAKANTLWPKGQCRPAVELLERAVGHFTLAGRTDEVGRTLSTSIQPLILLGEYDRALRSASTARYIFSSQNDQMRLARLEINVANIHHRQERFAEAIECYERAYKQLIVIGDTEAVGVALHNMAACLISLNDFDRASTIYTEARQHFRDHNMPLLAAQADYNIAYLYHLRGEYERALQALRKTREDCLLSGDNYHAALCDLDQSDIYLELNLAKEAVEMASQAVEGFERLGMGYEAARSLTNMAIGHSQDRDAQSALCLFARARERFSLEGHGAGEALVDLYRAMHSFETGQHSEARELAASAARYFRSAGLARKAVVCELLLARVELASGALPDARKQIEIARHSLNSLDAPVLNFHAQLVLGQILEACGESAQSFLAYQAAQGELENLRCGLQREELKIAFMENKTVVYEQLIGHSVRRGLCGFAAEEAFGYMEQAKCRSLMDELSERSRIGAGTESAPAVTPESEKLRQQLNSYYHRIESEQMRPEGISPETIERLWAEARACENSLLRKLRDDAIRPGNPTAAQHQTILSIPAIQAALNPETNLIEYCQVNGQLLAAVITSNSIEIVRLAELAQVQNRLRMLHFQISKLCHSRHAGGKLEKLSASSTVRHLQDLHNDLVAPLRHLLKGKHLVFIPHGALYDLPMHALHDGREFLIDRFTVSYAPSASVYAFGQRSEETFAPSSLILGFSDPKAPWILREVEEAASLLPNPRLLVGQDATQDALREYGPGSSVVHIATHGHFRRDNPMFSSVRLGDSHLNVYDLYNLRLPVDLLTLSGCGTGQGMVAAGDEFMGLARGLLYAGARSLLLTLWDVNDRSTADLVRSFYTHYQGGVGGKAHALRSAMLELRERNEHPFYWAPLMLVGRAP